MSQRALILAYDKQTVLPGLLALAQSLRPEVESLFLVQHEAALEQVHAAGFPVLSSRDVLGWSLPGLLLRRLPRPGTAPGGIPARAHADPWPVIDFEMRSAARARDLSLAAKAMNSAAEYLDRFISFASWYRPDLLVAWNGYILPWSVCVAEVEAAGGATFVCERGFIPGTIVVDSRRVNAGSYLCGAYWDSIVQAGVDKQRLGEVWDLIRPHLAAGASVVGQPDFITPAEVYRRLGIGRERKLILCPAQIENDTNTVLYCDGFRSNAEVLRAVVAAAPPECFTVFKTHPEDTAPAQDYQAILGERGAVISDINVQSLLEAAHCTVVRNSTVGFEGLLRGKPAVVLGRAIYSHKGFTWDVPEAAGLAAALAEITAGAGLPADKQRQFDLFLTYFVSRYHFFLNPDDDRWEANQRKRDYMVARTRQAKPDWPACPRPEARHWADLLARETAVLERRAQGRRRLAKALEGAPERVLVVKLCSNEQFLAAMERLPEVIGKQVDLLYRSLPEGEGAWRGRFRQLMPAGNPKTLLATLAGRYDLGLVLVHNTDEPVRMQKMVARAMRAPVVLLADERGHLRERAWRYPGAGDRYTA